MGQGETAAANIEFVTRDSAQRLFPAQAFSAELRTLPGFECGEHLCGESLMNFEEIKIRETFIGIFEHV